MWAHFKLFFLLPFSLLCAASTITWLVLEVIVMTFGRAFIRWGKSARDFAKYLKEGDKPEPLLSITNKLLIAGMVLAIGLTIYTSTRKGQK